MLRISLFSVFLLCMAAEACGMTTDSIPKEIHAPSSIAITIDETITVNEYSADMLMSQPPKPSFPLPATIYAYPYSTEFSMPDYHRMWINTAVLGSAFFSTLFVLECLPENATSWNRAELQDVPAAKRWFQNVFKRGPEWDHDNPIFNYILHPYAGAVYFMSARSCGFNFWQSALYCSAISTIGWEFGIEACMERPSIQDIFITPIIGSMIGEGFYHAKRYLVAHDYRVLNSRFLGGVTSFLIDPVNEIVDLFRGNPARRYSRTVSRRKAELESSFIPAMAGVDYGFTVRVRF